jgi:ABC-type lipoprotein export system ATPase subunit
MDEPTGNIDSKTAKELIILVKQLNENAGVTIIIITHDENLANQAKRIVRMLDGSVIEEVDSD